MFEQRILHIIKTTTKQQHASVFPASDLYHWLSGLRSIYFHEEENEDIPVGSQSTVCFTTEQQTSHTHWLTQHACMESQWNPNGILVLRLCLSCQTSHTHGNQNEKCDSSLCDSSSHRLAYRYDKSSRLAPVLELRNRNARVSKRLTPVGSQSTVCYICYTTEQQTSHTHGWRDMHVWNP